MPTYNISKPKSDRADKPSVRRCLDCRDEFLSSWAGERICRRCKSDDESVRAARHFDGVAFQ